MLVSDSLLTWPNHVPELDETMGAAVRSNSTYYWVCRSDLTKNTCVTTSVLRNMFLGECGTECEKSVNFRTDGVLSCLVDLYMNL